LNFYKIFDALNNIVMYSVMIERGMKVLLRIDAFAIQIVRCSLLFTSSRIVGNVYNVLRNVWNFFFARKSIFLSIYIKYIPVYETSYKLIIID